MPSAARKEVIGERSAWAHENIILNNQTIPQINSAFQGHSVADPNSTLNKRMIADITVVADDSAFNEMSKGPDAGASSNGHSFVHQRMGVDEGIHEGKRNRE